MSVERYTFEVFSGTTCFWICFIENELSLADCTLIVTQKDHMLARKGFGNKDAVRMMSTSLKRRRSVYTEINPESFEYGYFPLTETVFVVQFF